MLAERLRYRSLPRQRQVHSCRRCCRTRKCSDPRALLPNDRDRPLQPNAEQYPKNNNMNHYVLLWLVFLLLCENLRRLLLPSSTPITIRDSPKSRIRRQSAGEFSLHHHYYTQLMYREPLRTRIIPRDCRSHLQQIIENVNVSIDAAKMKSSSTVDILQINRSGQMISQSYDHQQMTITRRNKI